MQIPVTIKLEKMSFFAYHGVYSEEQKNGNWFEVDVEIETLLPKTAFEDILSETIDYVLVYKATEAIMNKPQKLLETICYKIATKIKTDFLLAQSVRVVVSKLNPPLGGKCEKTSVKLTTQ